jgi:hypothetical protein
MATDAETITIEGAHLATLGDKLDALELSPAERKALNAVFAAAGAAVGENEVAGFAWSATGTTALNGDGVPAVQTPQSMGDGSFGALGSFSWGMEQSSHTIIVVC